MELHLGILAPILLLALALVLGLIFKVRSGRGRSVNKSETIDLGKLKAKKSGKPAKTFGKKATLLQFSTQYCAICPGVSRQLGQLETKTNGVLHLEVDITDRLDLAAHFQISQTPTVFILNPSGEIKFRVSGAPKPGVIQQELEKLGAA